MNLDPNFRRHIGTYQGAGLVRELRYRAATVRTDNSYPLAAILLPALIVFALAFAAV